MPIQDHANKKNTLIQMGQIDGTTLPHKSIFMHHLKIKKILYLAIDFQCIWLAIVIQADKTKKLRYRIASQTIIHISFKDKKFNT